MKSVTLSISAPRPRRTPPPRLCSRPAGLARRSSRPSGSRTPPSRCPHRWPQCLRWPRPPTQFRPSCGKRVLRGLLSRSTQAHEAACPCRFSLSILRIYSLFCLLSDTHKVTKFPPHLCNNPAHFIASVQISVPPKPRATPRPHSRAPQSPFSRYSAYVAPRRSASVPQARARSRCPSCE